MRPYGSAHRKRCVDANCGRSFDHDVAIVGTFRETSARYRATALDVDAATVRDVGAAP